MVAIIADVRDNPCANLGKPHGYYDATGDGRPNDYGRYVKLKCVDEGREFWSVAPCNVEAIHEDDWVTVQVLKQCGVKSAASFEHAFTDSGVYPNPKRSDLLTKEAAIAVLEPKKTKHPYIHVCF